MEHKPVLFEEAIRHLAIRPRGTYVDCTLGGASHAEAIIRELSGGRLYGLDQDAQAMGRAQERLGGHEAFVPVKANFRHLRATLAKEGVEAVDGVLYDLGVSSFHFDDAARGFSYRFDGPLDMRMDESASLTAEDIVNTRDERELKRILYAYGEERFAPRIAKEIVRRRREKPFSTTLELVDAIKAAMPAKALHSPGHPAKRTFQALRIAVNDELAALEESLADAIDMLKPGGRIVVISFHSLEDKIVKRLFKEAATVSHPEGLPTMPKEEPDYFLVHKKVIRPTPAETEENPRAKSAKMRVLGRFPKEKNPSCEA